MSKFTAPALGHLPAELFMMIGEEKERGARSPFLTHEQHGGLRTDQEQGRGGPISRRFNLMMEALAEGAISHLVMVLKANDEALGRDTSRIGAARLVQVHRTLAAVKPTFANGRRQV